jgi:hypothetical protein
MSQNIGADPARTIFFGGPIITMDPGRPFAEALAVEGRRILAVGTRAEVMALINDRTRLVDLAGRTLMPGLIEPHSHPLISALLYDWVDLSAFSHAGPEEVMAALKQGVERARPGEWVSAFGYDPILLRGLKSFTADQLDVIAPDNPVFIMIQSMHTMFVNHAALKRAGVTEDTPQPAYGQFEKDQAGKLTGVIIEQGGGFPFILSILSELSKSPAELVTRQLKRYARAGYTTVGAMGEFPVFPDAFGLVRRLVEQEGSPVRMVFMDKATDLENGFNPDLGADSDRFRRPGVKFWYDGSPYTGNMFLDEPYLNSALMQQGLGVPKDTCGYSMLPKETLAGLVRKYHGQGRQVSIHAQGDRAIRDVIDVFEEAIQALPRRDHRHRIEHGALFPLDQLARATALGLTTSWHVNHIHYYGEALRDDIIGVKRAARLMPVASAQRAGQVNSLHNDSPMYPAEPFKLVRTAATRATRNNAVIGPDQAVSVQQALEAVTINAAWQMFMEDMVGSLRPGKYADLAVLSDNPLTMEPLKLDRVQVLETWSDGCRIQV